MNDLKYLIELTAKELDLIKEILIKQIETEQYLLSVHQKQYDSFDKPNNEVIGYYVTTCKENIASLEQICNQIEIHKNSI